MNEQRDLEKKTRSLLLLLRRTGAGATAFFTTGLAALFTAFLVEAGAALGVGGATT